MINKNRKEIYYAETWKDYVTKVVYQFNQTKFFFHAPQRYVYGDEEDDLQEAALQREDIEKEHKKGIYTRNYYVKKPK